jgi:hypothetical protein
MTTTINADTITGGAVITGDTSGNLALQSGGTTGLTVSSGGVVTFANPSASNITINTFNAQSSATDITLTISSNGFQLLNFTAANLSVILPAATAYTGLGQKFVIRNTGINAFKVKNSSGNTIYWVRPDAVAQVWLKSNSGTSNNWEIFTGDIDSDNGLAWLGVKVTGGSGGSGSSSVEGLQSGLSAMMAPDLYYYQYAQTGQDYGYLAQQVADGQWVVYQTSNGATGLSPNNNNPGKGAVINDTSFLWASDGAAQLYWVTATRGDASSLPSLALTNTLTLTGLNISWTAYSHSDSLQLASGIIPTSYNPGICVISGVGGAATVTSAASIALGTNASTNKTTDAIMFDDTNGLLYVYDNTLNTHYFKLFNLSGTTITYVGTTRTINVNPNNYTSPRLRLSRVSATEALFYYEMNSNPGDKRAVKIVFDSGANDIAITSYTLNSVRLDGTATSLNALQYYIFNKGMVIVFQTGNVIFFQKLMLVNGTPTLSAAIQTDMTNLAQPSTAFGYAVNSKCDALTIRFTERERGSTSTSYTYFYRTLLINDKD